MSAYKAAVDQNIRLRTKVNKLNQEIEDLRECVLEYDDFLNLAPFDFKNGVTDTTGTIDEGEVLGNKYYCEMMDKFKAFIEKLREEQ